MPLLARCGYSLSIPNILHRGGQPAQYFTIPCMKDIDCNIVLTIPNSDQLAIRS
jgi:hypothetical protein